MNYSISRKKVLEKFGIIDNDEPIPIVISTTGYTLSTTCSNTSNQVIDETDDVLLNADNITLKIGKENRYIENILDICERMILYCPLHSIINPINNRFELKKIFGAWNFSGIIYIEFANLYGKSKFYYVDGDLIINDNFCELNNFGELDFSEYQSPIVNITFTLNDEGDKFTLLEQLSFFPIIIRYEEI